MVPMVNSHVHIPPDFSTFVNADALVAAALSQGVRAIGVSSRFDLRVDGLVRSLTRGQPVKALFGLELVTEWPELERQGIRVNDPAIPGRLHLMGKGIDPFRPLTPRAERVAVRVRERNDARAHRMIAILSELFGQAGFALGVTPRDAVAAVAGRGGVAPEWVSLQEEHIAWAFQEALFGLSRDQRGEALYGAFGGQASSADLDDAVAVRQELMRRLLVPGTPGYMPVVPVKFTDAYNYILDLGGVPCYAVLADGAEVVAPFELSPADLATGLIDHGIYAAEFIPQLNRAEVVDQYIEALTAHGIVVMGGTEPGPAEVGSLAPACRDGALSPMANEAFFEGSCVMAAHADNHEWLKPGYVDQRGELIGDLSYIESLISRGESLIGSAAAG